MKKWLKIGIWGCIAILLLWWFFPRRVAPHNVEITSISLESGHTGRGCELESPEDMETLLETLEHTYYIRTLPRLFASGGYSYIFRLYDTDENQVQHVTVHPYGGACIGAAHIYLVGAGGFGKLNDILCSYTDADAA